MTKQPKSRDKLTEVSDRIVRLKSKQAAIASELSATKAIAYALKPLLQCLRCGFKWRGRSIERPPNYCARCHSAAWNREPLAKNSRHPSDPPNPHWLGLAAGPAAAHPGTKRHPEEMVDVEIPEIQIVTGLPPLPSVPEIVEALAGLPELPVPVPAAALDQDIEIEPEIETEPEKVEQS